MLWRLSNSNQRWRTYDHFLIAENRWRAPRYGVGGGLIDFGRREIVPVDALIHELVDLLQEDAEALDCRAEIETALEITANGNSADRQRAVFEQALKAGQPRDNALRTVVRHLIDEYHADL
jgi:carboxylate-amine ligase